MEKISAEELHFDYLCGKCFSHASRSGRPGKVLSCCDFLCYDCGNGIQEPFTCPSCRKQNVKFVSTDDPSIPAEVARNISDPENCLEQLKSVLLFQIKHYKTMLHRAVGKMMRDKKEFHRRLSMMENGEHIGETRPPNGNRLQQAQPQLPLYQDRQLQQLGSDGVVERPRKMSRPSTAGPAPTSSSSTSAVWRTGTTPSSARLDISAAAATGPQGSQLGVSMQGRLPQRLGTASGDNRENLRTPGVSLSSLLDGGNSASGPSRFQQDDKEQQQQQQQQHGQGQSSRGGYRQPFSTPSVAGRPPTPSSPGQGIGPRLLNGGTNERPITPSTLFVQNAQQSQYFPRQMQQQVRQQQQQSRIGPGHGQGPGLGPGGLQGGHGPLVQHPQQGYPQRPSSTPAPLNRLRSPHGHVPLSRPRTPGTMASGAIAVTVSQQRHLN